MKSRETQQRTQMIKIIRTNNNSKRAARTTWEHESGTPVG